MGRNTRRRTIEKSPENTQTTEIDNSTSKRRLEKETKIIENKLDEEEMQSPKSKQKRTKFTNERENFRQDESRDGKLNQNNTYLGDKNNNATVSSSSKRAETSLGNGKQTIQRNLKKMEVQEKQLSDDEILMQVEEEEEGEIDMITPRAKRGKSPRTPKSKQGEVTESKRMKKDAVSTVVEDNAVALQRIMQELAEVKKQLNERQEIQGKPTKCAKDNQIKPIKSPSVDTIYVPAVKKLTPGNEYQGVVADYQRSQIEKQIGRGDQNNQVSEDTNSSIDNILTGIRNSVQEVEENEAPQGKPVQRRLDYEEAIDLAEPAPGPSVQDQARERIINAEKFKAQIEAPRGIDLDAKILDDDDLMFVSCNVEENTIEKVEKGKFFEMDRFLNKPDEINDQNDEQKMVLVNRGGWSAWEPAGNHRKQKITNVHLWEKAFRVYMAIYTRVNPHKASEMIQYLHTIHLAASKFSWENVAQYDRIFRRWMEKNPNRSWGKTLSQMWNICMTDPVNTKTNNVSGKKEGYSCPNCWKFNKGNCNYPNCQFPHKCTYCGGTSHGANACFKKGRKSENKNQTRESVKQNTQPSTKNNITSNVTPSDK